MNIVVEGTKEILYSPYLQNHEEYQIIDPTWTEEVNKAGSLEFTILPAHCLYSSYKKLSTILDITDDSGNEILWRGRILNDQKDFYLKKQVYCEGSLAFLLDSVVRPYNYKSTTIDAWFSDMIKNHNAQVNAEKQFINGGCDTFSYKVSTSTNDYSQTLDALQDKVNALGGYLKLDNKILSWSASSGQISDQVIRFGENLLDFTDYIDGANVYTVLIPLGKTTDDVALTIKTANKGKDYLESDTGIALFGRIVKTATYSEIEDAEELKKQGMSDLLDNIKLAVTITVTAADLSYLNADVKTIRCGDYVRIISPPHEIDSYFQCTKIVHYLDAPEKNEYTFGRSMYSLSDASTEHTANNYASFVKIKDTTSAIKETTKALEQDVEVISATADEAKAAADAAKAQAEAAEGVSNAAKETADSAKSTADSALASANEAQNTANAAKDAAGEVTEKVTGIVKDVNDAKTAADNAWKAASTAQEDATTAKTSAANAEKNAAEAKTAADAASTKSEEAVTTAEKAQSDASEAKTNATKASETAAAAKADAAQAQKEIDTLGENLTTLSNTMKADYARKTDLTDAEASLSTKISQNAANIETTAKKVSVIDETANNAADLAATAQTKAEAAQTKADQATSEAAAAQTKADEASQAAQTAQSNADTAKAAAENAQSVADKAKTDLAEAQKNLATVKNRVDATEGDIAKAQEAVTTAQAAAEKAQNDANAAATKASSAQDVADAAKTNASLAQTAANQASAKAEAAQTIANEAKVNASDAQKKAADAVKTASDAKTAADNAAQTASDAQDVANAAKANATAAQTAADDAKKKSDQAAADLVTAKKNLEEVSGRVDSTAEEVEAAKTAVATAQAAADKAKTDAATAQSTADTAKTNASNAQKAADTAKTAADNAQKAADDAQTAADKAQDDVNALTKRVVNAETSIKQNSEAIDLRAKKTEVTQSIKDIQIGGRNLQLGSGDWNESAWLTKNGVKINNDVAFMSSPEDPRCSVIPVNINAQYTFSIDIKADVTSDIVPSNGLILLDFLDNDVSRSKFIWVPGKLTSDWQRVTYSFTVPSDKNIKYLSVGLRNTASITNVYFRKLKVELGNKATDWTPAPEDLTADAQAKAAEALAGAKTYADAQIKVAADSISQNVSKVQAASIISSQEQFYQSTSPTALAGGSWSNTQPAWANGKYIWRRTLVTYGNNKTGYTPSETGVCITGNTGATGSTGLKALQPLKTFTGTYTTIGSTASENVTSFNRTPVVGDTFTNLDASSNTGTWQVTAVNNRTATFKLLSCVSSKGAKGDTGATGKGIKSTAVTYQASSLGTTVPTGTWTNSVPTVSAGQYLWTRTVITYTDNTTSTSYSVGKNGNTGATGPQGKPGIDLSQGKMLNTDPFFLTGNNGLGVYNNSSNGNVIITRAAKSSDNPITDATHEIIVKNVGSASPGIGGAVQSITSRANAVFVRRIIAKIPTGRKLANGQNLMGTGYTVEWLTSQAGTGKFTEYMYKYTCGASGTFNDGGHMYVDGSAGTSSAPVTWYIAYCTTFDMTRASDIQTADDVNNKLTELRQEVSSNIEETGEAIKSSVYEKVYLKDDVDTLLSSVNTEVEQTKTSWQVTFNQLVKQLNDYSDGSDAAFDEIRKYIRFEDGNILLGNSSSPLILRIRNDRIQFLQNGYEVAYISDQRMYNTTCEIINQLRIADSAWTVETNNNGDTIVSLIGL